MASGVSGKAEQTPAWTLAANEHFEIYSDAGADIARSTLTSFEQLRTWFLERTKLIPANGTPARVIAFRSAEEYREYRSGEVSDAHYIGTESQDFIAMPVGKADAFSFVAHEYAHLMLHANGLHLQPWLSEGLAEFFSTVRVDSDKTTIGGDIPARRQTLSRKRWIPLNDLLAVPDHSVLRADRGWNDMFYAESWALTQMLMLSPAHGSRFDALLTGSGVTEVYGKPLSAIAEDLKIWVSRQQAIPLTLPALGKQPASEAHLSRVSTVAVKALLAEMLMTTGEIGRARTIYTSLHQLAPKNPQVLGGLGTIALLQGDVGLSKTLWQAALNGGIEDAFLCYRFAMLAEGRMVDRDTRPMLERAVLLRPTFDDAHYALAMNLSNSREFEKALDEFHAIRDVSAARKFSYWAAVAYAFEELNDRDEAVSSATKAFGCAKTAEEKTRAQQLIYLAQTDLTVQVVSDKGGQTKLSTARKPHDSYNWNPFIQPGDQIRTVDGELYRVDCEGGKVIALAISTTSSTLSLSIADPTHVQVLNGPGQFACGTQDQSAKITATYAAFSNGGILRGLQYH